MLVVAVPRPVADRAGKVMRSRRSRAGARRVEDRDQILFLRTLNGALSGRQPFRVGLEGPHGHEAT